jgi:hypothetical protein
LTSVVISLPVRSVVKKECFKSISPRRARNYTKKGKRSLNPIL